MTSVINIVLAYNVLKLIMWKTLFLTEDPLSLDYAKRAKKSLALRNLNFNEESPQMGRPQIDSDFVFY